MKRFPFLHITLSSIGLGMVCYALIGLIDSNDNTPMYEYVLGQYVIQSVVYLIIRGLDK